MCACLRASARSLKRSSARRQILPCENGTLSVSSWTSEKMMNFHSIRNKEKRPGGRGWSAPPPPVHPKSLSKSEGDCLRLVVDSVRSIKVLKVLLSIGQLAMWRMASNVRPHSLHLEHELWGIKDLVAIARCRTFLYHECTSLLVVSGEWMSLARSDQGME